MERSRKKDKRWLKSKCTDTAVHFIPCLIPILRSESKDGELVLAIDGSSIGKGCMALMVSLIWRRRAIPICWVVRRAAGEAGFDSNELQQACLGHGWEYVLKTGKDTIIADNPEMQDACPFGHIAPPLQAGKTACSCLK